MPTPNSTLPPVPSLPTEGYLSRGAYDAYLIPDLLAMRPFLMSLVSDCDLWMYLSSHGSLTAGRCSEDRCIFPYETDDKLHLTPSHAGPLTWLEISSPPPTPAAPSTPPTFWTPFADFPPTNTRRSLSKSLLSTHITFEESHPTLPLTFSYTWTPTREFGFVRACTLTNTGSTPLNIRLLDGFLNILPAGPVLGLQQGSSCLINAYSQSEIHPNSPLATYALSSIPVDRAEPAESLHANTAFSLGLPNNPTLLLTTDQFSKFRSAPTSHLTPESLLTGRRGNYFATTSFSLPPNQPLTWYTVVDAYRDQAQVAHLRHLLRSPTIALAAIQAAITSTDHRLRQLLAPADAFQLTSDRASTAHHLANTLFNTLRGGALAHNGLIPADDFRLFVHQRNPEFATQIAPTLASLSGLLQPDTLLSLALNHPNPTFYRIASEYLPLHFGRRHGDPSRPWNRFAIRTTSPTGTPIFDYQGNWRDIFQNWEALAFSFPQHIHTFISRFLNASTADGFNPYRVTRDGLDWEVPDPHDPWGNIGYWGDHQIIYLLKLLEAAHRFQPHHLPSLLNRPAFSYANVPYRLKPYAELLKNTRETITFDFELNRKINANIPRLGADAKLLTSPSGNIIHATLIEKLLVPALSKLANLVHGAGIWLNTQRPEWNDANNALVGIGVSMVTQHYLRRYLQFLLSLLEKSPTSLSLSPDVSQFLSGLHAALNANSHLLSSPCSDTDRKSLLDALAAPFDTYRSTLYASSLRPAAPFPTASITSFLQTALKFIDAGIHANQTPQGLYHAYNLFKLSPDHTALSIGRLPPMLEGQVAFLSSGLPTPSQAADLLDALFASPLFRKDQNSFLLYPERPIAPFLDRSLIPTPTATANPLLSALIAAKDPTIILQDIDGHYRFSPTFRKDDHLRQALSALSSNPKFAPLVAAHSQSVLDIYESIFHHSSFTGRSGSMFGYEGIGCIYWHMVAKLLLATQECYQLALSIHDASSAARLKTLYYRIRSGLGFNKSAAIYGAFPPDPYSHTPKHAGAQQPGMTGQVKEELLTRLRELGLSIHDGALHFSPDLLQPYELTTTPTTFTTLSPSGHELSLPLPPHSIAFTFCQTPILITFSPPASPASASLSPTRLEIHFTNGTTQTLPTSPPTSPPKSSSAKTPSTTSTSTPPPPPSPPSRPPQSPRPHSALCTLHSSLAFLPPTRTPAPTHRSHVAMSPYLPSPSQPNLTTSFDT